MFTTCYCFGVAYIILNLGSLVCVSLFLCSQETLQYNHVQLHLS